jgi:TolB-like protein/predicted Zn-dependent protease
LPFENRSEDKANAYFADGIQDEILTRLSKVTDLRVISRISTQQYKSAPENLREIGKQLGVAHLLEGSVQKVGNTVLVNVQLIRVATDEHLWAESYNRKLDDVFAVEGEVAGAIAEQLDTKLSGSEKQELAAKPTNSSEAYDAYLRGLAFSERAEGLYSDLQDGIQAFETAVRLDANFAIAWARLAQAHCTLFFNATDASAARRDAARKALDSAMRLQPGLLETQLAEAYYYYMVERDYDHARNIFEQIRVRSPNNSEAARALALISRRQGRWDESLRRFDEAIELDPRNLQTLTWASDTYTAMRQFPGALKLLDRILDIAPADSAAIARKVGVYQAMGELDQADAVLDKIGLDASNVNLIGAMAGQSAYRRRYPAATELLQSYLARKDAAQGFDRASALLVLGELQRFSGDAASAKLSYSEARHLLEPALSAQPDNAYLVTTIAGIDSGLGDEEVAVKEAERAIQLLPAAKDAFIGPGLEETMARVLARFGKTERAIAVLQHLATTPYNGGGPPITPALLRLDPSWDNLRGDPRFQKLCDGK